MVLDMNFRKIYKVKTKPFYIDSAWENVEERVWAYSLYHQAPLLYCSNGGFPIGSGAYFAMWF